MLTDAHHALIDKAAALVSTATRPIFSYFLQRKAEPKVSARYQRAPRHRLALTFPAVGLVAADITELWRRSIPATCFGWSARQQDCAVAHNRYPRMKLVVVMALGRASFVELDAPPVRRDIRSVAIDWLMEIIDPVLADPE